MVERFKGSGRLQEGGKLATHKQDFNAHHSGGDWRHGAPDIDMEPVIAGLGGNNVQEAITNLFVQGASSGTGFVSIGNILSDGYAAGSYNVGAPGLATLPSAFAAAAADKRLTNGGVILLMAGTYRTSTTIELPAGITVLGELAGTIVIGEMTEQPVFKVLVGPDRPTIGGDSGSGSILLDAGSPTDETKFINLVIADNLDGYVTSGGQPIATMKSVPMIELDVGTRVTCEGVKFIGRLDNGAVLAREKTLEAIGYAPDITGNLISSHLTMKNCFFDGFKRAIDFSPNRGELDHLIIDKCTARTFGTESSISIAAEDNCFVNFTLCNATLTNNHFTGFGVNASGTGPQYVTTCFNIPLFTDIGQEVDNTKIFVSGTTGTSSSSPVSVDLLSDLSGSTVPEIVVISNNWAIPSQGTNDPKVGATITCGDGINTFGDFNGASALIDAVAYAAAAGLDGFHIILKSGSYNADNIDLSTGTGAQVIIEGVNSGFTDGAIIQCTNSLGATSAALTSSGTRNQIVLRNLHFQGTGELAIYLLDNYLLMEDCKTSAKGVRIDVSIDMDLISARSIGPHIFMMRRCALTWSGSGFTPPLHYSFRDGAPDATGFVVEDCDIDAPITTIGMPILRVENVDISSAGKLSGVLFNRCNLRLGTSADDPGSPGDMQGNSGLIELVAGTTSNMDLGSFEWRDCDVSISGVGTHRPIFYWRAGNGTGSFGIFNDDSIIKIIGGRWEASAGSTTSPIYIGGNIVGNTGISEIIIQDIHWGYTIAANYGTSTVEVSGPAVADWAMVYIKAQQVVMKNVTWITNNGLSTSGELFVDNARRLIINGLYLGSNNYQNGTGSAPSYRVKLITDDFPQFGMVDIANIMIGAPSNAQATNGLLQLERTSSASSNTSTVVVRNCLLMGNDATGGAGIYIPGQASASGHFYYHIVDCVLHTNDGPGIWCDFDAASVSPVEGLRINRCRFIDNVDEGILLDLGASNTINDVIISDCSFRDNDSVGIHVSGTAPWNSVGAGLSLIGNVFDTNNLGASAVQVLLDSGVSMVGVAYGNASTESGGIPGSIQTGSPAPRFRGTETSYSYIGNGTGAAIEQITYLSTQAANANRRFHTTGARMMHNRMRWLT